jgi:hypothetical protein
MKENGDEQLNVLLQWQVQQRYQDDAHQRRHESNISDKWAGFRTLFPLPVAKHAHLPELHERNKKKKGVHDGQDRVLPN